jgi:tRNA(adenine34) deaminase
LIMGGVDVTRRETIGMIGMAAVSVATRIDLTAIPHEVHERFMRLAITKGMVNPSFPFGTVIVRASDLTVMASGVNTTRRNPTFHGEIDAINDYVRQYGSEGWDRMILYTTGEPCPMCMSAIVWAGVGAVVFGTSIATLARIGFRQIDIGAASVARAAPFYRGSLVGAVLASETDRLFAASKGG